MISRSTPSPCHQLSPHLIVGPGVVVAVCALVVHGRGRRLHPRVASPRQQAHDVLRGREVEGCEASGEAHTEAPPATSCFAWLLIWSVAGAVPQCSRARAQCAGPRRGCAHAQRRGARVPDLQHGGVRGNQLGGVVERRGCCSGSLSMAPFRAHGARGLPARAGRKTTPSRSAWSCARPELDRCTAGSRSPRSGLFRSLAARDSLSVDLCHLRAGAQKVRLNTPRSEGRSPWKKRQLLPVVCRSCWCSLSVCALGRMETTAGEEPGGRTCSFLMGSARRCEVKRARRCRFCLCCWRHPCACAGGSRKTPVQQQAKRIGPASARPASAAGRI